MEKKKILLVAISVGIFLVIAIGAAILIFSSRNGVSANAVVMERSNQDTYQPFPSGENIPVYPQLTDEPTDTQFPITPDTAYSFPQSPANTPARADGKDGGTATRENNFYTRGETRPQSYSPGRTEVRETERTAPDRIVINIPRPESAKPVIPSETPPVAPQARDKTGTAASPAKPAAVPPAKKPAVRQPASAKPVTPAKPTVASQTAKPATPARKTYDAYWVQAGSFSTRTHADGAKETLASKGITSIIENRELGGKTFYRVRIGPYTSQNEADYWLALIQTLSGFEESLVWRNQAQRLN